MRKVKLTIDEVHAKLVTMGFLSAEGEPIAYNAFKNRASIHRYGPNKITFIGTPGTSLFAFYAAFANDADSNVMKEAYASYLKLVKGNMTEFEDGDVRWKERIPVGYDY